MSPSPDTQDTEELKPCPFCGARQVIRDEDRPVMMCEHCEAQGPRISFGKPNTMEECWNTRPDSPVTVMVEALEGALPYLEQFSRSVEAVDHELGLPSPQVALRAVIERAREALARISR